MTKAAGIPDDIIVESGYVYLRLLNTELNMLRLRMVLMYYNDSKGTNPEAAVKAIEAMANVLQFLSAEVMIKALNLTLYVKAFKDKVKLLVLIGQTSEKIAATCQESMDLIQLLNMLIQWKKL